MKQRKVATITLPFLPNYGWILQAYALQTIIKRLGCETILLERNWNRQKFGFLYKVKRFLYYKFLVSRVYRFYQKNIIHSPHFTSSETLRQYCKENGFYAVVAGSDQIWRIENTRGAGLDFFLDFVDVNQTKRISYAASFATNVWKGTLEETKRVSNLLSTFTGVSVRERNGVDMCKSIFNIDAQVVLDPTLLLDATDYYTLFKRPNPSKKELVTYVLDSLPEKDNYIERVAKLSNCSIHKLYRSTKSPIYRYKSVEHWLSKIASAEYVIVDSFHGMVFAIIFQKQFLVIENKSRGSERFVSLLSHLGLMDRMISDVSAAKEDLINNPIDYKRVNEILLESRRESIKYLTETLQIDEYGK